MDKFFQVFNDNNDLIIDSNFKMLTLKRKIPLSALPLRYKAPELVGGLAEVTFRDGAKQGIRIYSLSLRNGEELVGVGGRFFQHRVSVGYYLGQSPMYRILENPYTDIVFPGNNCRIYRMLETKDYTETNDYSIVLESDMLGASVTVEGEIFYGRNDIVGTGTQNEPWERIRICDDSNIYVYVFGYSAGSINTHGTGIQLADPNGGCVYDSTKKYLRVIRDEVFHRNDINTDVNTLKSVNWRKDEVSIFPMKYAVAINESDLFGVKLISHDIYETNVRLDGILKFSGNDPNQSLPVGIEDKRILITRLDRYTHLQNVLSFGNSSAPCVGAGFASLVTGY